MTPPDKRGAASRWRHLRKWRRPHIRSWRSLLRPTWPEAVAVALGVYGAGIYLLWGAVREPLFFKVVAVDVLLGAYAAGVFLLWRAIHKWDWSLFLKWAAIAAALGVCAVGILLLWGVWDGTPVAAAFTRVGGPTRVETALGASRFWLTPPQKVVETQTDSSQVMLKAAQCAVAWDAPLLFTSPDPKRQRRVDAMIKDWRKIETPKDLARTEMITIKSQHGPWRETALPAVITITNRHKACHGKSGDPTDIARLSTLKVLDPLIRLRRVRTLRTLAPVVVFAAAIEPGHLPDVAIGLALAAHMAKANGEKVSLVVVPHYLESDPELENKLQSQHELITGGVVLGQTPTVPEDTRALLRQLLTTRDRHGVLGQLQDNLGSIGPLIAALLALGGLAAATRITALIVIEPLVRNERIKHRRDTAKDPDSGKDGSVATRIRRPGQEPESLTQKVSHWRTDLDDKQVVTVQLRSGRLVTGTIESQMPVNTHDAAVFRMKKASSDPNGAESGQDASPPEPEEEYAYVLVSVKDIEQIHFNDSKSEAANADQKRG